MMNCVVTSRISNAWLVRSWCSKILARKHLMQSMVNQHLSSSWVQLVHMETVFKIPPTFVHLMCRRPQSFCLCTETTNVDSKLACIDSVSRHLVLKRASKSPSSLAAVVLALTALLRSALLLAMANSSFAEIYLTQLKRSQLLRPEGKNLQAYLSQPLFQQQGLCPSLQLWSCASSANPRLGPKRSCHPYLEQFCQRQVEAPRGPFEAGAFLCFVPSAVSPEVKSRNLHSRKRKV